MKEKDVKTKQTDTPKEENNEADKTAELTAEIEKLKAEIEEKDNKYLRMAAEYDNFRRRSREEREGVYDTAVCDTVGSLLEIIDNLGRASGFEDGNKVKDGLTMTLKSANDALKKLGVEPFGLAGETFDPKMHNAVLHVEDETLGENIIVEVFSTGYKKGNKIIRFAMVKTAN